jgi:diguanylate cyclase (GGDEF)-like protein
MWKGARRFDNQQTSLRFVFIGAAVWLLALLIEPFHAWNPAQCALIISSIVVGYCLLIGTEFLRRSGTQPALCWPAITTLAMYAGLYLMRVWWPGALLFTTVEQNPTISPSVAVSIDILLHVFCSGLLLAYLAMQRTNFDRGWTSMVDPETGTLNRRGFFECGARALQLMFINNQCATIVEFDLKYFKTIDGNREYSTGDNARTVFCDVVSEALRPCDLFGRISDRRFACLLANTSHPEALIVAEKIKRRISHMEDDDKRSRLHMTITAGYGVTNTRHVDLQSLILEAEDTLHHSTANRKKWVAGKTSGAMERVLSS